jgi:tetratricopeptide (TPR) repeat protein
MTSVLRGLVLALAVGCAAQPPGLPAKKLQAIEANNRGTALFNKGEYGAALAQYRTALDIERSIENEDGIAANLINLSITYQQLGERHAARSAVEEIVEQGILRFPRARVGEAALRTAILLLEDQELDAALAALEQARSVCASDACNLSGRMDNVEAQAALLRGELVKAQGLAARALAANRARGDREEVANSLRLLGGAALESGRLSDVDAPMLQALEIDKQLALPSKIFRDLVVLGRVAKARGASDQANQLFARAMVVARASRNALALAEAKALMDGPPAMLPIEVPVVRQDSK